jgi:hypothetical protein
MEPSLEDKLWSTNPSAATAAEAVAMFTTVITFLSYWGQKLNS